MGENGGASGDEKEIVISPSLFILLVTVTLHKLVVGGRTTSRPS